MRRKDLFAVTAALVIASAWMAMSSIHRDQNSDSVMMSLISLYRWTPMFWEQDRSGMLVPALAMPLRDHFTNLIFQAGLTIFFGLSSFFLLGYYVAGRRRGVTIGALGALLFILTQRSWVRFNWFVYIQQFPTSLFLALSALILLDAWQRRGGLWRPVVAVVSLWLAMWVNISLAILLAPLILLRRFLLADHVAEFDRLDGYIVTSRSDDAITAQSNDGTTPSDQPSRWRRLSFGWPAQDWIGMAGTISGLLLSMAASRLVTDGQKEYTFLGPSEWFACAVGVLRNLPEGIDGKWFVLIVLSAATGLLTLRWPAGRQQLRISGSIVLALMIPAAVQFLFMTSLEHVHRTNFGHYVYASVFVWQLAFLAFAVMQWAAVMPDGKAARRVPWGLVTAFVIIVAARHGRPGVGVVEAALQQSCGKYAPEVVATRSTHVLGEYWRVWTTVFYSNMLLQREGSTHRVWGIASGCLPTAYRWSQVPLAETRMAEVLGEERFSRAAQQQYGIPPLVVERELKTIRILKPTVALSEAWPARYRR
jgi:hypothetical protein